MELIPELLLAVWQTRDSAGCGQLLEGEADQWSFPRFSEDTGLCNPSWNPPHSRDQILFSELLHFHHQDTAHSKDQTLVSELLHFQNQDTAHSRDQTLVSELLIHTIRTLQVEQGVL